MKEQIRTILLNEMPTLQDFYNITKAIITYITENTISVTKCLSADYTLRKVNTEGQRRLIRPINSRLFISDVKELDENFLCFCRLLSDIAKEGKLTSNIEAEYSEFIGMDGINRTLYTVQQTIGCGLDLFTTDNTARKNFGTRFEELMYLIFKALNITGKKGFHIKLKVPGESFYYKVAFVDIILSPFATLQSSREKFNTKELILSTKTSSKDRMKLIFTDRFLLNNIIGKQPKVIAIFHNDVQRKGSNDISSTFVADIFLVFCKYFGDLEGIYYIDPPSKIQKKPWSEKVFTFDKFILNDLWRLLE